MFENMNKKLFEDMDKKREELILDYIRFIIGLMHGIGRETENFIHIRNYI